MHRPSPRTSRGTRPCAWPSRRRAAHVVTLALALAVLAATPAAAQDTTLQAHFVRTLAEPGTPGRRVGFSPDGRTVAVANASGAVRVWSIPDGRLQRTLVHDGGATDVKFSPDGAWIATAGYDGHLRLWRASDGAPARTIAGHTGTVWALAFSPDSRQLASVGEDSVARVWRVGDGAPVGVLRGHRRNVWAVAYTRDGGRIVTASYDFSVRTWDAHRLAAERTLRGHEQAAVDVTTSPDGRFAASVGDDEALRIWRLADGAEVRTLRGGSQHVWGVDWSRDGRWIASAGREKGALGSLWSEWVGNRWHALKGGDAVSVRLWRARDGKLVQAIIPGGDAWAVALSADARWLVVSRGDGAVQLWQLAERVR